MPSFSYQGTFREGQWRAFRTFVLQERRDFSSRAGVIASEIKRIGRVALLFARDPTTEKVTQERFGIMVIGQPNSSIGKLLTAYCALGGNPLDISLFLWPDDSTQPGTGYAFPKGFSYSLQGQEADEDSNIDKFKPSRIGGTRETPTDLSSRNMGLAKQAFVQEMYHKRILLEERILKLSDLVGQLDQERVLMVQAQGRGSLGSEQWTPEKYNKDHSVPCLVYLFDSTFGIAEADGRVPEGTFNLTNLGPMPQLLSDILPAEGNNAL